MSSDNPEGAPAARHSTVVRCEKHGLRYDSATQSGCVRCRKEAGVAPPARRSTAAARKGDTFFGLGMRPSLAITAGIVLVTTIALYFSHTAVVMFLRATTGVTMGSSIDDVPASPGEAWEEGQGLEEGEFDLESMEDVREMNAEDAFQVLEEVGRYPHADQYEDPQDE